MNKINYKLIKKDNLFEIIKIKEEEYELIIDGCSELSTELSEISIYKGSLEECCLFASSNKLILSINFNDKKTEIIEWANKQHLSAHTVFDELNNLK